MSGIITISGKEIANNLKPMLVNTIQKYKLTPKLAIILVGDNQASMIYVKRKLKLATEIGIEATLIHLNQSSTEDQISTEINKINNDKSITGVIIQLPLPNHIDKSKMLSLIDPKKDVDGLHPINAGLLTNAMKAPYNVGEVNNEIINNAHQLGITIPFIPCTPLGCMYIIHTVHKTISGLNAVVYGNSNLVGKPMARLLLLDGATVTTLHSKSKNQNQYSNIADIIVLAAGKKNLLRNPNDCKDNVLIIDVGINIDNGKISGDLDVEAFVQKECTVTPVPGGIGPMTVISLMYNCILSSFRLQNN